MNNLNIITKFEFLGFIKKKKNWATVMVVAVISVLIAISPFIINLVKNSGLSDTTTYVYYNNIEKNDARRISETTLTDYGVKVAGTKEQLNALLEDGKCKSFYEISNDKIVYYTTESDSVTSGSKISSFSNLLQTDYLSDILIENNLQDSYSEIQGYTTIETKQIELTDKGYEIKDNAVDGNKIQAQYAVAYVLIMLIYILMVQYGNFAATAVANEKSSRTMESLIYTTNTNSLIFGKVFGIFLGIIIQIVVMFSMLVTALFIAFKLAVVKDLLPATEISMVFDNVFSIITPSYIALCLLLAFIAFLMTLFIFAAFASTVSKMEDLPSTLSTATIFVVVTFFISIGLLISPNNKVLIALSYVPFFTPLATISRYSMGSTSSFDIAYSLIAPSIFVVLTALFASKMYKVGVLLYGTKPSAKMLLKEVFSKKQK